MHAQTLTRFGSMSRLIALCTSAAAALSFAIAFTSEKHLSYQLGRFFTGREQNPDLVIYLAIVLAVSVGYVLASRQSLAAYGGALTLVSVAALYAWCQIRYNLTLEPLLLVIAVPAVFHMLEVRMHRAALRKQLAASAEEPVELAASQADTQQATRELAAGAA